MNQTPEQEAIIQAVARGDNVSVDAGAGCAKTTTIEHAAKQTRRAGLALAFNKAIAGALSAKLPSNIQAKTFNALGHGALARGALRGKTLDLKPDKQGRVVRAVSEDHQWELGTEEWLEVVRGLRIAQQELVVPDGQGDDDETWATMADRLWLDEKEVPRWRDRVLAVLRENNQQTLAGTLSFDDQVYGALTLGGRFVKFDLGIVDEKQDLSRANVEMLARSVDGQLVAVGDPKQAIYGFRGAAGDACQQVLGLRQKWTTLPLMTSFRVPHAVAARQQEWVPGFKAWEGCHQGRVSQLPEEWTWSDYEQLAGGPNSQLTVLCRNNAPLMRLVFVLLRNGKGAKFLGKDIGKQLGALATKIVGKGKNPKAEELVRRISEWMDREASLARAQRHEWKLAGIQDRGQSLIAVAEGSGAKDLQGVQAAIAKVFDREVAKITLATGHGAKGLEWPSVLLLDPWRIPSKWALRAAEGGDEQQLNEERNLRYVMETRTQRELVFANMDGMTGVEAGAGTGAGAGPEQ